MMRQILAAMILIGFIGSMAGCNTMEGFGKDVERAGEATQSSANRNR